MASRRALKVIRVKKDPLTGQKPFHKIQKDTVMVVVDEPGVGQIAKVTVSGTPTYIRTTDYRNHTVAV